MNISFFHPSQALASPENFLDWFGQMDRAKPGIAIEFHRHHYSSTK